MSFTDNQNFETQPSGQADWDTGLNSNFSIMDRGWHIKLTTAETISTGDILAVTSGGLAWRYNSTSLDLRDPLAISYKSVASGQQDLFISRGIINSYDTWSGHITPGLPVFVSAATPGFLVSSYSAAWPPVGLALANNAVAFNPGQFSPMPIKTTQVVSLAVIVGSVHDFTFEVGHRGIATELIIQSDSSSAHAFYLWSGSIKANTELLYETLTTSVDGGASDFDISSIYYRDVSPFGILNTDVASPGLIFGRLECQSSNAVGSSDLSISITVERFR